MAENEKVTLDDLPPVDFAQLDSNHDIGVCYRCSGMVMWTDEHHEAHKRWHAAIETLTIKVTETVSADAAGYFRDALVSSGFAFSIADSAAAPVQQGGGGGDTGDELQPLRDQLIERFNLVDDGAAGYGGDWLIDHLMKVIEPHVEQQVEQYADKAEACDRLHAGLSRGETDRLRRVEDALVAAGAPNRSEPGDPGGLQVAWISQQQGLIKELRKQVESLSQASQGQRRDLRAVLGMGVDTTWSQMIRLIGQQRDYVALLERKSRDCTEKHTPVSADEPPSLPHEWSTQDMANTLASQGAALERLRDVVRAAGCPVETDVIDWIETQLIKLAGYREHECTWTTDQVNARVDERRVGIIALLELAARGREKYAELMTKPLADRLHVEAETFRNAAGLVKDPTQISLTIPTEMLPEAGKLTDDEPAAALELYGQPLRDISDEALSDLLVLVGVTPSAAQLSAWTDEQREQAANWAGLVHLQASDNDVDVPERPAFLNEQPAEACTSLYLHNGELLTCTVTDRSGHTAHYSGQNDTVTGHEIAWGTSEAVPVPWPLDQEPPAGINTLRDTGAGETLSYLCRATRTWVWSDKPALPHGPYKLLPWAEAVLDADGDLHVVRP